MHPIIQSAVNKGHRALSEFQSKRLLSEYGIPVSREMMTNSPDDACAAAEKIGFPVAVKACSHALMHKTEVGVIELNVKSAKDVSSAYQRIISSVSIKLEGVLVCEMVAGMRELVLGMSVEPQFGPCVMVGLGGVMTEILNDTAFRVAPFDLMEAREMIHELKSHKLFESFRGEQAVDSDAICKSLIALGEIALANPEIAEIDINPVKIDPYGKIKAVDALVVLKGEDHDIH